MVVRKRPLTRKELKNGDVDMIEVRGEQACVVKENKKSVDLTEYQENHKYFFDNVFDVHDNNLRIYQTSVFPLIECMYFGYNTACFAYG